MGDLLDSVIDVMIHPIIDFVNLSSQIRWVKVDRSIPLWKKGIKFSVQHANDFAALVADDRICLLVPQDGNTKSSRVALGMFKVEVSHLFHIFVPGVGSGELSRKFLIRCWKTPP